MKLWLVFILLHLPLESAESEKDYPSNWAAITAIAPKIGCTPETLRVWYQKYLDKLNPVKVQQLSDQERIKQL